jgi:hypothetical protein
MPSVIDLNQSPESGRIRGQVVDARRIAANLAKLPELVRYPR